MARDDRWRTCIGTWDRLRWARLQKFATAEDAALALGENAGTYRAYERSPDSSKHISLMSAPQKAMHFAARLGVRWEWLLNGDGEPWRNTDENVEKVVIALEAKPEAERADLAEAILRLLKAG